MLSLVDPKLELRFFDVLPIKEKMINAW